jgi:thiosulfate dehydrogenase
MLHKTGSQQRFLQDIRTCFRSLLLVFSGLLFLTILYFSPPQPSQETLSVAEAGAPMPEQLWQAPDSASVPATEHGALIQYGRELISHTARYLGPKGVVAPISNGMNCQNCHLKAGTKPFGNNYSAVASTYPKFRARSGGIESIEKRVNDCLERSLNGKHLADNSKEMRAIVTYIMWLGTHVPKGTAPKGSGLVDVPLLERPADPANGKILYAAQCQECHGKNGEGLKNEDGIEWIYPPLWGANSYNVGAGLYRLSRFAGYVKANMPNGTSFDRPKLTDEEAWDIAAFVNSMPRPGKPFPNDWPDIATKPFDHPFGPFADTFSEEQHKYGPFAAIKAAHKKK